VKGIVKDHEGKPSEGADVQAVRWRDADTLGLRAITAADGSFVLENAPSDEFTVRVASNEGGAAEAVVRPVDDAVAEIRLNQPPAGDVAETTALKEGDAVPALRLTTLAGETIRTEDWKGKVVLLVFWATWCGPCVAEVPYLVAVHEKFGARKDFAMVGVSLDDSETALRDFVRTKKIQWAQIFGEAAGVSVAREAFGVRGLPTTFLIGRDGKIVAVDTPWDSLVEQVGKELSAAGGP
jgi:thiol-disulfide isomerase/thioredoxin